LDTHRFSVTSAIRETGHVAGLTTGTEATLETETQPSVRAGAFEAATHAVRELDPSVFAFVMATGIVSVGLHELAAAFLLLSNALLVVAVAGYLALWIVSGWRLLRWKRTVLTDLRGAQAFCLLTVVAASNVLSSALVTDYWPAAAALFGMGVALWLLLGYGVPLAWITSPRRRFRVEQVNGTWFHCVVGTQSVAVAAASLATSGPDAGFTVLALACWAVGLMLYLLIAALVLARLLLRPVEPAELVPAYWIFMGAAAITALAGLRLLRLPQVLVPRLLLAGASTVLLSFATWLIPLLLALGVWRHVVRRFRLGYSTALWSLVFPLGMYGLVTHELGQEAHLRWLSALGGCVSCVAAAAWAAVFLAMVNAGFAWARSTRSTLRSRPSEPDKPAVPSGKPHSQCDRC
jgi:tellurite resistance protein TehA-like permease